MDSWVKQRYPNPTSAQLLAEKARSLLSDIYECTCEAGECPPEHYFEFKWNGETIFTPSYVPIIKTCAGCRVSDMLYEIMDPQDMGSIYI